MPGWSEDTGELNIILLGADGRWRADHMSSESPRFWRAPVARDDVSVPHAVRAAADDLLESPPATGPLRAPRHPEYAFSPGRQRLYSLLARQRASARTAPHPDELVGNFMRSHRVCPTQRPLLPSSAEYRMFVEQWSLPEAAPGTCIVPYYAELAINRHLAAAAGGRSARGAAPGDVPPDVWRSCYRGSQHGAGVLWPTLAAGHACMPILVWYKMYAPLALTARFLGYPSSDPLLQHCESLPHITGHRLLCQGVSLHVFSALFAAIRDAGWIRASRWRVAAMFAGADTFAAALRAIHQEYECAWYSDIDDACLAACAAVHPDAVCHRVSFLSA